MGNEPFSHMLNYLLRNLVKKLNQIKISEDKLETSDLIKKLRIISSGDIDNLDISLRYLNFKIPIWLKWSLLIG